MQHSPAHPIARFALRVHEQLLELAHTDPMFMPTSEKKAALLELEQSRDLIAAIEMRIMATGSDVTEDGAYRTVSDFVSDKTHADRAPLASLERLSQVLEHAMASPGGGGLLGLGVRGEGAGDCPRLGGIGG